MLKFIKKNKLKFISYFLCAFAMALFTIISFSCKTYAYSIDSNGNLVGDNLFNNYEPYSNSGNVDYSYSNIECRVSATSQVDSGSTFITYFFDNIQIGTTYYFKIWQYNYLPSGIWYSNAFGGFWNPNVAEVVINATQNSLTINIDIQKNVENIYRYISLSTKQLEQWEPYGVWYSENNYDTLENLYDNSLEQYNDLVLGNNYGYWKYIDYVEFYVNNSNIYVPNTDEQNEWEISDLYNNNILKIGGYFDTFPLTLEPYQSNYNEVDSYINFNAYTPSESFIMTFGSCVGCNIVIYDENSNAFTTTISENSYLVDINLIRENIPSFGLYIIEMYITPNNAEQNGVYFANNDYISAYNKGYNVATSNADRKYIPQITDLQSQINSLNNNINELSNNIDTLRALNTDLQNQINNSYSWQTLFFAFADTPFRVVSNVLGFELFGLNLFATFIGMVTVFGVVYLLKKFL